MNFSKHKQMGPKKYLGWLAAVTVLAGSAGMASAQTSQSTPQTLKSKASTKTTSPLQPKFLGTAVVAKGNSLSTQPGFVFQGTMYIPIWYVMQDLKKMNIASTWDGQHWRLTLPKGWSVQTQKNSPKAAAGQIEIFLNNNGVLVAPAEFAAPPGAPQVTTFVPIWYVMQALDQAEFHSAWNGKQWTLTPPSDPTGTSGSPSTTGTTATGASAPPPTTSTTTTGTTTTGTTATGTTATSTTATSTTTPGTTATGTTATGTGGSGSPTNPAPQPPVSTAPQAGPGQVSKATFAVDLLQALGIQPQQGGTFADITASNPDFGYVTAAANTGILPADGPDLYGVLDQVPLAEADAAVWAALGIGTPSDEPGGSASAWGNVVGLNPAGLSTTQPLTLTGLQTFLQNLHTLQQGYQLDANGVLHVVYPVANEYNATFSQMPSDVLSTLYANPTAVQSAITQTYQFFDGITAHLQGIDMQVSLPNPMGSSWFAYAVSGGTLQYSLNSGNTWTTVTALDTRNLTEQGLTGGSSLWLKAPENGGMSITYNELAPATQGVGSSVVLGEIQLQNNDGTWTVQRVNVTG